MSGEHEPSEEDRGGATPAGAAGAAGSRAAGSDPADRVAPPAAPPALEESDRSVDDSAGAALVGELREAEAAYVEALVEEGRADAEAFVEEWREEHEEDLTGLLDAPDAAWDDPIGREAARAAEAAPGEAPVMLPPARRRRRHPLLPWIAAAVVGAAAAGALMLLAPDSAVGAVAWLAPLLSIAGLRVADIVLGTVRTVLIVAGHAAAAGAVAFLEAAVWLAAAGIVLADLSLARGAAFAAGVGIGTALGVMLARRLRLGLVTVRVFVPTGGERRGAGHAAAEVIRATGVAATVFPGWGRDGPVDMVLSVTRRREAALIINAVTKFDPAAFTTLGDSPGPGSVIARVHTGRV